MIIGSDSKLACDTDSKVDLGSDSHSGNKYVEFDSTSSSMRDAVFEAYDSVRVAELKQGFGSTNSSEDNFLANLSTVSSRNGSDSNRGSDSDQPSSSDLSHSGGYSADGELSSSTVSQTSDEFLALLSDDIFKADTPAE